MEANTVSQVNHYIKNMFIRDHTLSHIYVKGEISNCKYHTSGHIYFTLKDQASALSCVMFASRRRGLDFRLEEGQSVVVLGNISVYERDGKYQLYADSITQDGVGRLYEEYEKRKKRLSQEGLFLAERKKKIPLYASRIGVVTASTGAVIQDICNVAGRRNPYIQIILYPARVQGQGAAETIIRGLDYFEQTDVDTVIIARGGGSIEDLWAFNEESLARAIAACSKPVISAVGHETDTTIADFVADLRAPTPSAAAELAVYSLRELDMRLEQGVVDLQQLMGQRLERCRMRLRQYNLLLTAANPEDLLRQQKIYLADCQERLARLLEQRLEAARHQMELYIRELKGLSPLYKLQGGYSYVEDMQGQAVCSVEQLAPGQKLTLTLQDGKAGVTVEDAVRHKEL